MSRRRSILALSANSLTKIPAGINRMADIELAPQGPETTQAPDPAETRVRAARILAVAADLLQIGILPVAFAGALSPVNDILDICVGAAMVWLLGWHIAFLPSFLAELLPLAALFPSWTAAVLFVTRRR